MPRPSKMHTLCLELTSRWMRWPELDISVQVCTLDLQSAYMHVPMHPDDAHKTTPFGMYEDRRMAFGLCNAPATFQRLMQTAFRD